MLALSIVNLIASNSKKGCSQGASVPPVKRNRYAESTSKLFFKLLFGLSNSVLNIRLYSTYALKIDSADFLYKALISTSDSRAFEEV